MTRDKSWLFCQAPKIIASKIFWLCQYFAFLFAGITFIFGLLFPDEISYELKIVNFTLLKSNLLIAPYQNDLPREFSKRLHVSLQI